MVTIITTTSNLPMNFHHVPNPMRPIDSAPITIADVGATRLSNPEADWKAVIIRLGLTPTNPPNGAMIPIVALARPDEDGIKNDIGR